MIELSSKELHMLLVAQMEKIGRPARYVFASEETQDDLEKVDRLIELAQDYRNALVREGRK
jgi:hypothetical protein